MVRVLKGLEHVISMTAVDWLLGEEGWRFGHKGDADPVNGATTLEEVCRLTC